MVIRSSGSHKLTASYLHLKRRISKVHVKKFIGLYDLFSSMEDNNVIPEWGKRFYQTIISKKLIAYEVIWGYKYLYFLVKLIYFYLCRCSNRNAQSFPSRKTIRDSFSINLFCKKGTKWTSRVWINKMQEQLDIMITKHKMLRIIALWFWCIFSVFFIKPSLLITISVSEN